MERFEKACSVHMDFSEDKGWERGLIGEALAAREAAYAPYSGFKVGAALLGADGTVYRGCNIENAAYTPSNCAERTAFFCAVAQGARHFKAIAIVGGRETADEDCPPCGVCRQVMMEFCSGDFLIILGHSDGAFNTFTLEQLMPKGFGPKNLG